MIISRTPVRLSFFGGGTDYPLYYDREQGAIVGTTINKYIYISLRKLSNFFDYNYRISYAKLELVKNTNDIIHPSVRECIRFLKIKDGLEINIVSDLPARTGLGSSSAFTVGLLNTLYASKGVMVSKRKLANDAIKVEQDLIGERVGSQDQFHAAFGGFNKFTFSRKSIDVFPLPITEKVGKRLNKQLLLFYTKRTRYASEILREQLRNTESGAKDEFLNKMYDMVDESIQYLVNNDLESFGHLLDSSWNYKQELSTAISNKNINHWYLSAIKAGAYGGKLAGAGGGGFLMFVVPVDKKDAVRKALNNLLEVRFKFDNTGSQIIYYNN